ncbi:MAG: hypothetical protein GDA53_06650 [Rhodobacteraceae bacterium]|nr:hypothetical protein [Paracoccaceae bacterium]
MQRDPGYLLQEVLAKYTDADKWAGMPFEHIRHIPNTKVGDVGQDFVEALCRACGLECAFPEKPDGTRKRQSPWDMRIGGRTFELKTASEDVGGAFQFNHIRYHRRYDALLCIGIAPSDIYVGAWTKADVTTGRAGNLVSMEKATNASYKLTKKPDHLKEIGEFYSVIRALVTGSDAR